MFTLCSVLHKKKTHTHTHTHTQGEYSISHSADVNSADDNRRTPHDQESENVTLSVVECPLSHAGHTHKASTAGCCSLQTPLSCASENGCLSDGEGIS